jgi:uncharacterized membrane protein
MAGLVPAIHVFIASSHGKDVDARDERGHDRAGCAVTLAPLLNAEPVIQVHAYAAMTALALGIVHLSAPKGTLPHRSLGWIWVILMLIVSITAFFIHEIRMWGPWSPIHLLAVYTW